MAQNQFVQQQRMYARQQQSRQKAWERQKLAERKRAEAERKSQEKQRALELKKQEKEIKAEEKKLDKEIKKADKVLKHKEKMTDKFIKRDERSENRTIKQEERRQKLNDKREVRNKKMDIKREDKQIKLIEKQNEKILDRNLITAVNILQHAKAVNLLNIDEKNLSFKRKRNPESDIKEDDEGISNMSFKNRHTSERQDSSAIDYSRRGTPRFSGDDNRENILKLRQERLSFIDKNRLENGNVFRNEYIEKD